MGDDRYSYSQCTYTLTLAMHVNTWYKRELVVNTVQQNQSAKNQFNSSYFAIFFNNTWIIELAYTHNIYIQRQLPTNNHIQIQYESIFFLESVYPPLLSTESPSSQRGPLHHNYSRRFLHFATMSNACPVCCQLE